MNSLKVLIANKYFWMAMILWMMLNVIFYISGTSLPYYCKYIFHDDSLYGGMYLMETVLMIGFIMIFCPILLKKFGKRNMSLYGMIFALIGHGIYLMNPLDYNWVLFSCIVRGIGFAPLFSVVFGFLGDVVEYGQWKFHVRLEGLTFSGGSVGTKIGSGLTSAIDMIVGIYEWGPIFVAAFTALVLYLYKLDKIYPQIMADLAEREARGEL